MVRCVCRSFSGTKSSFHDIASGSVVVLSEKDCLSLLFYPRKRRSFLNKIKDACVSCVAFPASQIPCQAIVDFCQKHHIALLVSCYDSHYLESRLTRIIREKVLKAAVFHGAFLQLHGLGVLITGDAGTGKTTCALALARSGHIWIADDLVEVTAGNTALLGKAYGLTRNLAAFRGDAGITIENISNIAYTQDEAFVDLWCELQKGITQQMQTQQRHILGIALPFSCFPSSLEIANVPLAIENWVKSFVTERGKYHES